MIPGFFIPACVSSNDFEQAAAQLTEGRNLASEFGGRIEGTLSNKISHIRSIPRCEDASDEAEKPSNGARYQLNDEQRLDIPEQTIFILRNELKYAFSREDQFRVALAFVLRDCSCCELY